jgi:hypothetical protein
VHPEANLVGRAGAAGDELGSTLIGSRLVTELMRLCFLLEREYAPYSKWFGTAFARLDCGPELGPVLLDVVRATGWRAREDALVAAYERVTLMHNELRVTEPATTRLVQLWDRPYRVAWADVPDLLRARLSDPAVLRIAERWPIGAPDQFRDLLWRAEDRYALLPLFGADPRT